MLKTTGSFIKLAFAVYGTASRRNISLISAGVAFYTIFAIFPGMAATIAIWGFFADPIVVRDYLELTRKFIPAEVFTILATELDSLLATTVSTLGWTTAITLTVSLYSVHNGVAAMVSGLNSAQERARASGPTGLLKTLVMTLALIGLGLGALTTIVAVPIMLNFIPAGPQKGLLVLYLPWSMVFLVVLLMLGLFYRWGPNVTGKRPSWVTPGSFMAALFWAAASMAFSAYLANFGSYNRIYGSIGAVIALLMWLYISAYIILLGGVVNAERDRMLERQKSTV